MQVVNRILCFLVGAVFTFSGLVKLNDPKGTEIKLHEYFEVFASDQDMNLSALQSFWEFLAPYSLQIGILLSVLEVVWGIHLLIRYRVASTLVWLLFMVIFFGFLTFYSAYFNKVTDCGCFGDAIKLSPWQSFYKDMVLLVLILWLNIKRKHVAERASSWLKAAVSIVAMAGAFYLSYYALQHLPPFDFRAYKVGSNIPELMDDSLVEYGEQVYIIRDKINGEEIRLNQEEYFANWEKYKDTAQFSTEFNRDVLNPEKLPKITDYQVSNVSGEDITSLTFEGPVLLIIIPDVTYTYQASLAGITQLARNLESSSIKPIVLTATDRATFETFRHQEQISLADYGFVDNKVLLTMIRSNPGLMLLQSGTVLNKWHYNDLPSASDITSQIGSSEESTEDNSEEH